MPGVHTTKPNQVQLPWGNVVIGHVQAMHIWTAQSGKDAHSYLVILHIL